MICMLLAAPQYLKKKTEIMCDSSYRTSLWIMTEFQTFNGILPILMLWRNSGEMLSAIKNIEIYNFQKMIST